MEKSTRTQTRSPAPNEMQDVLTEICREGARKMLAAALEESDHWRRAGEWTESPVAKFRFSRKTDLWTLFCRDRHGKWYRFKPAEPARDLQELVRHVDRDPTGIFWG